jgi:hypothetical protein
MVSARRVSASKRAARPDWSVQRSLLPSASGKQLRLQGSREPEEAAAEDQKLMIGSGSWIVGILLLFLGLPAAAGMVSASACGGGSVAVWLCTCVEHLEARQVEALKALGAADAVVHDKIEEPARNAAHGRFDLLGAGGDLRRAGIMVGWGGGPESERRDRRLGAESGLCEKEAHFAMNISWA